jgi:tartrate dehydratase beta subunit/fumarate hydratase class I family protein
VTPTCPAWQLPELGLAVSEEALCQDRGRGRVAVTRQLHVSSHQRPSRRPTRRPSAPARRGSNCPSWSIRCNQTQSDAIKALHLRAVVATAHRGPSGAIRRNQGVTPARRGSNCPSWSIRCNQMQSDAIKALHLRAVVATAHRGPSGAIRCNQMQSRRYTCAPW